MSERSRNCDSSSIVITSSDTVVLLFVIVKIILFFAIVVKGVNLLPIVNVFYIFDIGTSNVAVC